MLDRPRLKRAESEPVVQPGRSLARPVEERYVLKVDGQAKASFRDKDMAVRVGQNIKQKSPVVLVTITDMRDGTAERVS
jgi:hypothetical protein